MFPWDGIMENGINYRVSSLMFDAFISKHGEIK